ncbi:hypothetical protein G6F35_001760 [Rhizopus arrhizus]|nr:hypothetical protein G6F35_001760 [Rhizopus arrhizus]KAG1412643.1 hypothetical protein G6F58_007907 [Rhizopus delemar]
MSSTQQYTCPWPTSHAPTNGSIKSAHSNSEDCLGLVTLSELKQGELYIIKIKLVTIALFQGWQDEVCCFYVLRTDLADLLRWSEARYLPNNFDAYYAFDEAGNPPIHLWTKQLKATMPSNWFSIFEEAKMMQKQWHMSYSQPESSYCGETTPTYDSSAIESPYQETSEYTCDNTDEIDHNVKLVENKTLFIASNKKPPVSPMIQTKTEGSSHPPSNLQGPSSSITQSVLPRSSSLPSSENSNIAYVQSSPASTLKTEQKKQTG